MRGKAESAATTVEYRRAFDLLERCSDASCQSDFKERVVEGMASVLGFEHTSFFAGPTFQTTFGDPTPVVGGQTGRMLPEYQARWWKYDLFSSPRALRMLTGGGVTSLPQLAASGGLPATADAYVRHFLVGSWSMRSAACLRIDLHGSHTGLIGIFHPDDQGIGPKELVTLKLLEPVLSAIGRGIPFVNSRTAFSELSTRQHEVVALIADGLSNAQIASTLCIAEDSVKKYVSRILAASGCQTRMELAIVARSQTL